MEIKKFRHLLDAVKSRPGKRLVAVNGIDANTLEALNNAVEMGLVSAVLTGNREIIEETCSSLNINSYNFTIIHAETEKESVEKAVELIRNGSADYIMKGLISTDKFMKILLKKEYGLVNANSTLCHVAVMEHKNYHKLLFFSDAGVIPYPDLQQKITMTGLLIKTAQKLGIEIPHVAVIAPTEQIIISIQSCMDGATIAKMSEHNQIEGGIVDGPMALDVAINHEAAAIKGFNSPVAGNADCLLFPNIDAANVFYKTNSKLCNAEMAGIIMGARIPAIVSSRGDSDKTKLSSIAMGCLIR